MNPLLTFRVSLHLPHEIEPDHILRHVTVTVRTRDGEEEAARDRAITLAQLRVVRSFFLLCEDTTNRRNLNRLHLGLEGDPVDPSIDPEDIAITDVEQVSYWVMGPDDLPVHPEPLHDDSRSHGARIAAQFIASYAAGTGYYRTAHGENLNLQQLAPRLYFTHSAPPCTFPSS